jgi:hypothetical protein
MAMVVSITIAIFISFLFLNKNQFNFLNSLFALAILTIVFNVLFSLGKKLSFYLVYRGNYEQALSDSLQSIRENEDEEKLPEMASQRHFRLLRGTNKIGSFQDSPIFEYIDAIDENRNLCKFKFYGTMQSPFQTFPSNCILVPPGKIYELQEK